MQARSAPTRRKPGPKPKGDRSAITVRVPSEHARVYEEAAREAGFQSLSDYLCAHLAQGHGLAQPEYLQRPTRASGQEPLDLPLAV